MRWTDVTVHVIDFEGSLRTGIVEFGVATLAGGRIERLWTRLCRPRAKVPPGELAVHGLDDAMLGACEPFEAEWTGFAALRKTGVLAAHFSGTEESLLRAVWPCPRLSPDFLSPGHAVAEWGPWIDTGRLAASLPGAPGPFGLAEVVRAHGLDEALRSQAERWCPAARRRFHCAPFDALACALVLERIARDDLGAPASLAAVLAASTADVRERARRQQTELF